MLRTLELRDFAIVDALELELESGLNVLSGETGAGKSILIDALLMLTGGRGDSGLIRAGREAALVQGLFEGAPFDSAARRLSRSGRHSARLDRELVTVAELAESSASLVAIFGQHGAAELTRSPEQRQQLDRLLGRRGADALRRYRSDFRHYRDVESRLAGLQEAARDRARRLDMLAFQIDEIEAAELLPGEDAELEAEAEALRHAERIALAAAHAFGLLGEGEGNAVEAALGALKELRSGGRHHATLAALASDLEEATSALQAVTGEVEAFLSDFQADPQRLDAVEARLARLAGLKRKYGASVQEVLAFRDGAQAERDRLENLDADAHELEEKARTLGAELDALAEEVSGARRRAAASLTTALLPRLAELGMDGAGFEVELAQRDELGPDGRDTVRFRFVAHPGEPLAPLSEVASGGELSRLMLALHVVTGSDVPVLAFDEVDAGIGGRTARAVGSLLRRLSERHQVMVVTHLPQVAAFADAHYRVAKETVGERTVTRVTRLDGEARLEELARMLSGRVTDTSLKHARELLEQASADAEG